MDTPFLPGKPLSTDRPLGRFLPPLQQGVLTRWVERESLAGESVIDPFGTSPRLSLEAAAAGARVLVAVNNPITRFVLERYLDPLSEQELQSTLAHLAATEKDGQRFEAFLLDLYRTRCSSCGEWTSADYFVWEETVGQPVAKGYVCSECHHAGEEPATPQDQTEALKHKKEGLLQARALEEVAPIGDPNRPQAEAALSVYPGRALYALVTLINKASQLGMHGRQAVALHALLLSALDAADNMWAHPEGRPRPKQLSASPTFREANIWRALEKGVEQWAGQDQGVGISWWPEGELTAGSVAIFAGSVRKLADHLPPLERARFATVPPRPNQAYWTLSALWAAWLWGRESAEPLRAALRRRRYDWAWHADALRQTFQVLNEKVAADSRYQMFIPEAEAGYLAACLSGFDAAGLHLQGRALRRDQSQAQLNWLRNRPQPLGWSWQRLEQEMANWISALLGQRGEPSHYEHIQFGVATEIAGQQGFASLWRQVEEAPISGLHRQLEETLERRDRFMRLDQRQDPETGVYWLTLPESSEALADRVERAVLRAFRQKASWPLIELDASICQQFPGILTPDASWVSACVDSYAEEKDQGLYQLREEDRVDSRTADLAEIRQGLRTLAERLDYRPEGQDPILWLEDGEEAFAFCVLATSILSEAGGKDQRDGLMYVLPGGRAGLIAEKARRDPRLARRLEAGLVIIKFRHVRRLLSDTTLTRENFMERLTIDPPEQHDPQLPLL